MMQVLPLRAVGSSLSRQRGCPEPGSKLGQSLICKTAHPVEPSPLNHGELLGAGLSAELGSAEGAERRGNLSSVQLACHLFALKTKAAPPEKRCYRSEQIGGKKKNNAV